MEKTDKTLEQSRHSEAHLLAAAIKKLYPSANPTIGPAIENGFYYDFDFMDTKITEADLPKIEETMRQLLPSWDGFERIVVTPQDAKKRFSDNPYKLELIEELEKKGEEITLYQSGDFVDLCRGGHSDNPKKDLQHFRLLSLAGAYWRGNEKNKMLTRIYGTAFPSQEDLDAYLTMLEEAKKRDHRKLARELDLIVFSDLVGAGLPLYTPRGAIIRNAVYNFSRQLNNKIGYLETALPGVNRAELFKVSGHYDKYKDDMFTVHSHYSDEEFFLKPMNCPQHCEVYKSKARSYRDLPLRYADFSVLYRDEKPGEINGLFRSRAFTQDDGHGFCREDQLEEEFSRVLVVIDEALTTYGFTYTIRLSLRDPENKQKYLGDDAIWEKAESALRNIVAKSNVSYFEGLGEAAIYGPKLDFMAKDSLGREWQISTLQLDMIMPSRFGLTYTDAEGNDKTPLMIHRAIIGSERFIAILIEHFAGKFPLWLSPVHVVLIPIADRHAEYATKLADLFQKEGIRVEVDDRSETMQAKIRDHTLQRVPYLGIIGDKETQQKDLSLSLRSREGQNQGSLTAADFLQKIKEEIDKKR